MKYHFITYGDERFIRSKIRIAAEARAFGFDIIHSYGPADLDAEFVDRSGIDLNARGGGWYMWKTNIIYKTLLAMDDGDIGVYCDSGSTVINEPAEQRRWQEYIQLLQTNNADILAFNMLDNPEYEYTKLDTFDHFGILPGEPIFTSPQFCATYYMFRKTASSMELFRHYMGLAMDHPEIFEDELRITPHRGWLEHRWDQSVLSILLKQYTHKVVISLMDPYNPFKSSRIRC